jgi:hypothetical protein
MSLAMVFFSSMKREAIVSSRVREGNLLDVKITLSYLNDELFNKMALASSSSTTSLTFASYL